MRRSTHPTSCYSFNLNTILYYEANGNSIPASNGNPGGDGYSATWTAFNMMSSVERGTTLMGYTYDADHNRVSQTETTNGTLLATTYYFNDPASGARSEFKTGASSSIWSWTDYITAGGELIGTHVTNSTATKAPVNNFFVRDHLGSVAVVTGDIGCSGLVLGAAGSCLVERDSYDAWGKRRNATGADDPNNTVTSVTTRGYTGHEMVPDVGLINMNARFYDPITARFLSPDPDIQVNDLQALNPYSYVLNNPLSATDPTGLKCHGWFGCTFGGFGTAIIAIAAVATLQYEVLPYLATTLAADGFATAASIAANGAVDAVLGGALGGAINSNFSWQGALIGGAEAGAFYGVGSITDGHFYNSGLKGIGLTNGNETMAAWAESPQFLENVAGHGLVGGLASLAEGGSFQSGFFAAGFSDVVGTGLGVAGPQYDNVVSEAITGGVGSVIGGGSFANGAETGAFGYLFNSMAGEIAGGAAGVAAAGGCDAATDGACVPADGAIVEGSAEGGSLIGDYLAGIGGRLGGALTRFLNNDLATALENIGYRIVGGAGRASEEYIAGSGPGTLGSTYVDITAQYGEGEGATFVRIQTVDTYADGTLTARESAAAGRIMQAFPNDELITIPK